MEPLRLGFAATNLRKIAANDNRRMKRAAFGVREPFMICNLNRPFDEFRSAPNVWRKVAQKGSRTVQTPDAAQAESRCHATYVFISD